MSARAFGARVARAIDAGHRTVVIDLRDVEFIDSAGAHVLLNASLLAERVGVELRLRRPRRTAAQVLGICGL